MHSTGNFSFEGLSRAAVTSSGFAFVAGEHRLDSSGESTIASHTASGPLPEILANPARCRCSSDKELYPNVVAQPSLSLLLSSSVRQPRRCNTNYARDRAQMLTRVPSGVFF